MNKQPRFAFTCGGTSGHINPALAIAASLREQHPEAEIFFIGRAHGLEAELVPQAGYEYKPVEAEPFPRRLSMELWDAWRTLKRSTRAMRRLLRQEQVDAVIGTGGYVTAPVMAAARQLGIPRILHEQNAFPGQSNRVMSRGAAVCLSFENTREYFDKAARIEVTGNPVRDVFFKLTREEARKRLGMSPAERSVLVTGGSQGARSLNEVVIDLAEELMRRPTAVPYKVIIAAGERHASTVRNALAEYNERFYADGYLYNMQDYMAAVDIVVCRAGASTCSELAALGKPSILVPYPFATGDHQMFNAKSMEEKGAALVRQDSQLNVNWLREQLDLLFERPEKLKAMGEAAKELAKPDAAKAAARVAWEEMMKARSAEVKHGG